MHCTTCPILFDTEGAKGLKIAADCIPKVIASFIGIILPLCYDVAPRRQQDERTELSGRAQWGIIAWEFPCLSG